MAIEELLQANLDTHWYAVNQFDELEVVEKDNPLTRRCKKLFDLCANRDSYAHIRYNQISMAASLAVMHETNRETVDKYLRLLERVKEKTGISDSPNEEEKSIVARYNKLAFSQIPAAGRTKGLFLTSHDIEKIEHTLHELVEEPKHQSQCLYADPIIFSVGGGLQVKISQAGDTLHDSDQKLYNYASGLKKAKSVCEQQKLDLLAFSDAVMIKIYHFGKIRNLLVETELDEASVGPSWYVEDPKRWDEIVRQLAVLILHTGANVTYWNLRPLKPTSSNFARQAIGFNDIEFGSVYNGLLGARGGLETLIDNGLLARKHRKDIIFKEIERQLELTFSDSALGYNAFSPSQISRHKEIVDDLRQRISIKRRLDRLPIHQPGKDEYYVDMEKEISLRTIDPFRHAQLNWDGSLPTDEQMMEMVVEELKRVGAITGVSSRKPDGWTLRLSGPAVEKEETSTEETECEQNGVKQFIYSTICDLILSTRNIVTQNTDRSGS